MRTIKFRAWDNSHSEMIDYSEVRSNFGWYLDDDDITLMQFTGLLDKNGKEIYEGDILGYWGKAAWLVGFVEGRFCFIYEDGRKAFGLTKSSLQGKEIIGNIYQNPELLK